MQKLDIFGNKVFVHDNDRLYCKLRCNVISLATLASDSENSMEARISCNFRTHSYKFRKGKIMGAQGSNLPRNFPKMERLLAPKQPEICQSCAKVALQGKSCAVARKREKKLRSATSQFSGGTNQGRLSPQQPWRSSFHLRSTPPLSVHPQTVFGHFILSFVQF